MANENKRRPKEGWRQQNFRNIICVPSPICAAIFFGTLFIFSLALTLITLSFTYKIFEIKSDAIEFKGDFNISKGIIDIKLTQSDYDKIKGFLYVYVETEEYYQNHRIYLKSKSKGQMIGNSNTNLPLECAPLVNYADFDAKIQNYEEDMRIVPCGLMPASFVNTTISLYLNEKEVNIDSEGISWKYDNSEMYKRQKKQYLDIEDEHFKVWMRSSPTKTLKKLYGKIEKKDLEVGMLLFKITLQKNYLEYISEKRILLTTTTKIGGKYKVLGWTFFIITIISLFWCIFFIITMNYQNVPDIKTLFKKFSS
ncbi:hypothetical protein SteCoe_31695 [Stentor coeruleus]|uniref:Uncharacterized protein n=1 Tax=Stentor coeruleus TaxID=5963 RepID=A0A1R2B0P6_9CILI|nr:hypothetical protein SteCoe_31695 [Stentor coeruleus]